MTNNLHLYAFCIRPVNFRQCFGYFATDVVIKTTKDNYITSSTQLKYVPIKYKTTASGQGKIDQDYQFTKKLIELISMSLDSSAVDISKASSSSSIVIRIKSYDNVEPIVLNNRIVKAIEEYLKNSCAKEQLVSMYMLKEKNKYKYYVSLIERQYLAAQYRDVEQKAVCVKTLDPEEDTAAESIIKKIVSALAHKRKNLVDRNIYIFNKLEEKMLNYEDLHRISDVGTNSLCLCSIKDHFLKDHIDFYINDKADINSAFSKLAEDCYNYLNR